MRNHIRHKPLKIAATSLFVGAFFFLTVSAGSERIARILEQTTVKVNIVGGLAGDSYGSGFILTKDGLIGTNYHVIREAWEGDGFVEVEFEHSREIIKASILNFDEHLDFAILKVGRIRGKDYVPLALGDSDKMKALDPLYIAGYPITGAFKLQDGKINATQQFNDIYYFDVSIMFDKGNSGGPAVDKHGKLIGVPVSYVTEARSMNLLIKVNDIKGIISRTRRGERAKRVLSHGTAKTVGGMEFVYIPGGSFWMGSNESPEDLAKKFAQYGAQPSWFIGERPRHRVEVSGFWMGKYEVTQGQYEAMMGKNPSHFRGDSRRPVEQVSWHDAKDFCAKFGAKHGASVRLPTEAEWEYAARAGTETTYYWGNTIDGNYCWYFGNSNTTHPVGGKRPNSWGLYDMAGNVVEWCEDWYDERYYAKSPSKDPKGPASGSDRVLRGGSWGAYDGGLRSAVRGGACPGSGTSAAGSAWSLSPPRK